MHTALLTSLTEVRTDFCITTGEKKNGGDIFGGKGKTEKKVVRALVGSASYSRVAATSGMSACKQYCRHAMRCTTAVFRVVARRKAEKGKEREEKAPKKKDAQRRRGDVMTTAVVGAPFYTDRNGAVDCA